MGIGGIRLPNWKCIHSAPPLQSLAQNTRNTRTKAMNPLTWQSAIAITCIGGMVSFSLSRNAVRKEHADQQEA